MKIFFIVFGSFFITAIISSCGVINFIKDFIKNCKAKDKDKIKYSILALTLAILASPVIQIAALFAANIAFQITSIPHDFMYLCFFIFLGFQQLFYEAGVQQLITKLLPEIIKGLLKKFGIIKEEEK